MISAHYEEDGDSFTEEIKQLDTLRLVSVGGYSVAEGKGSFSKSNI